MKSDVILDAVGDIRDEYIVDAIENLPKRRRSPFFRIVAAAAVIVLCITAAVPALAAANVEVVYQLLYEVAPAAAQYLKPVNKACVDNGIEMEVVSASLEGDTAKVFIALKDLEGSRLDGTTDLFDSYVIRTAKDSVGTCSLSEYNEKTGIVSFLVTLSNMDGSEIAGDKVTFSLSNLLSKKNVYSTRIPFEPSLIEMNPEAAQDVSERGGGGQYDRIKTLLKPNVSSLKIVTPGAELSAVGYLDGMLHIQMHYTDILHTDNHGYLWLENSEGEIMESIGSVSFWDDSKTGCYEDYVFDITPDAIGEYSICGKFITCATYISGKWQITFPIDEVK